MHRGRANPRRRPVAAPIDAPRTDHAYKGYLLRYNHSRGTWHIFKDGHQIHSSGRLADAYQAIDALAPRANPGSKRITAREVNQAGTDYAHRVRLYGELGAQRAFVRYWELKALWEKQHGRPFGALKANPAGTRVARCVRRVKRSGRNVRSAYAICQAATRQSYATGKTLRNPLDIKVGYVVGPAIAEFRSLPRAAQYARALARHSGKRVRVWR